MGSGRVLAGSGCVLELKNDTSKIIEIHGKKSVLGSGGCKMERTWTLKMQCFGVLKTYEFIVKNRVWAG